MQLSFNGTAADSSGNNNNATLINGATYTTGTGQALAVNFNGTNQYATVPYSGSLSIAASYTVSLWEKGTLASNGAASAGGPALFSTRNGGEDTFDMQVNSSGLHADIGNGSGWLTTTANATVSLGSGWNMISYAVNPAGYTIYVNGQSVSNGTFSGTPEIMKAGETLALASQEAGGSSYGQGGYFNGAIEQVNVYAAALSAAQIAALYSGQYNAISAASPISVSNSATLDLVGVSQMTGPLADALTGSGGTVVDGLAGTSVILTTSASVGAATFSGALQNGAGTLGLAKVGAGTQVLAGNSSFSGATTVSGGALVAGAVNALSPNSAVTVSSGTLDVSGFANTIASLGVSGSGSLSLGLGNTLTSTGTAALAGTLNLFGTGTLGDYRLLAYSGKTGTFASVTGLGSNYGLLYNSNGTELDALHKAQVGALTVTAANPTVITGGTTSLTVNVANSAPAGSDVLKFTASVGGTGYGLSTTGSLAATNSGNLTGSFNSSSLAAAVIRARSR